MRAVKSPCNPKNKPAQSSRFKQGQTWELAPSYSITYALRFPSVVSLSNHQQLMGVNGKFSNITRADLLHDADRFGVRRPQNLIAKE